jgi:Signal peptidase (SPase) II
MPRHRHAPYAWPLLFILLVGADQLTKALAPRSWVTVDPGAGTWLPAAVGREFKGATSGRAIDAIGCIVLLAVGALVMPRVRNRLTLAGATVVLAGMTSNLLDRLGLAMMTQGVQGRVVVNWFTVGVGRLRLGNLADLCYIVGSSMLLVAAGAAGHRALRRDRARPAITAIAPRVSEARLRTAARDDTFAHAYRSKAS